MRPRHYQTETLAALFRQSKVVTMDEMKEALGTTTKMTVFRKLKSLPYRASYSHAGRYYTLEAIARYDADGLWSHGLARFSRHGSLLNTAEALVCAAEAGLVAPELQERVQVGVQTTLLQLTRVGRLRRELIAHGYLYLSPQRWEVQLARRKQRLEAEAVSEGHALVPGFGTPQLQEALRAFLAQLNERQRRLYVGFESLKLGRGGDVALAGLTGMNMKTVARGRRELLSHEITVAFVRRAGGGRPRVEKKRT